ELWHDDLFGIREESDCCIVAPYPGKGAVNEGLIRDFQVLQQLISEVRNVRNSKQISPKEAIPLMVHAGSGIDYQRYEQLIVKLANISRVSYDGERPQGAVTFLIGTDEFFVTLSRHIDMDA